MSLSVFRYRLIAGTIMAGQPRAYALAKTGHSDLKQDYQRLTSSLNGLGIATRIQTFETLLASGCPAINMTLPGCVRFLETGSWLNIHEVVELETGKRSGADFENELQERLAEWYHPRMDFEKLLKFRRDTHYSALNVGGIGPNYGPLCVRLGNDVPIEFATIFSGDPLQIIFDEDGNRVFTDEEVLKRFSTFEHKAALTAVTNPSVLTTASVVNLAAISSLLDHRDSIVEVHLHGAVRREHAIQITIKKELFESLCRLSLERDALPLRLQNQKRFALVKILHRLLELTDVFQIPLVGEGGLG